MPLVMVVDDVDVERAAARHLLEGAGYDVIEAEDGLDALSLLEGQPPDLILLDLSMPDLDGLSLLRFISDDNRWRLIPVVVVTGSDDPGVTAEAFSLGAREQLLKSRTSVRAILDAVKKHIRPASV